MIRRPLGQRLKQQFEWRRKFWEREFWRSYDIRDGKHVSGKRRNRVVNGAPGTDKVR